MHSHSSTGSPDRLCDGGQTTITQLFADQVKRTPAAVALACADQELTYLKLDDLSNRIAHYLLEKGVGAGTRVGIFMHRDLELVSALLAVLKIGGAYVPIDPDYPSQRISLIVRRCGAAAVLTTDQLMAALPTCAATVVSIDGEAAAIAGQPSGPVQCPASPENLAYVIFTSGSTGEPKAVMVEHRNAVSFFAAMDGILGARPGVWLAVTSISFDISVLELFWTLTRGFKVVLHGEEGTHTIADEIARHSVTHFQSTPSLARMLVADPGFVAALGSVEKLLLGGEALPASLGGMLRHQTAADIYNMYGPTETTVWSTAYRIPEAAEFVGTVPIGRPLANTRAYVLDDQLQPVPDGEPGELFLGGEGVARGYWERPDLTADRFPADRFAGHGRMYRTGDIARVLPDGNLEFLGRTDSQVKLRGHRVELGEIETALEQLVIVRQAVVVMREDRPGDKQLVAYLVPSAPGPASPADIRASLESKLPGHMVPAHYVFVDQLPLTANGKINRNALPELISRKPIGSRGPLVGDGPRSQIECVIAQVWAEALGVGQIDRDANVFDLGATSLMMPEVQIELQRVLAREVSLVELFEFHTVGSLAAHLAGDVAKPRHPDRAQRRLGARRQ